MVSLADQLLSQFQSSLPLNALDRGQYQVFSWVRDGRMPRAIWIDKNVVAPPYAIKDPAIFPENVDHFLTSHKDTLEVIEHCVLYTKFPKWVGEVESQQMTQ